MEADPGLGLRPLKLSGLVTYNWISRLAAAMKVISRCVLTSCLAVQRPSCCLYVLVLWLRGMVLVTLGKSHDLAETLRWVGQALLSCGMQDWVWEHLPNASALGCGVPSLPFPYCSNMASFYRLMFTMCFPGTLRSSVVLRRGSRRLRLYFADGVQTLRNLTGLTTG